MRHLHYLDLASLFMYPEEGMNGKLLDCMGILKSYHREAAHTLLPFFDHFLSLDTYQKQELYTKTFDVQALCYLDLGYVIFGEDYKRGTFLFHIKKEQDDIGVNYQPELPDHLSHILQLIVLHPEQEFVDELVGKIVLPSVEKIIKEFDNSRVDLKVSILKRKHDAIIDEELNKGNPYQYAFKTLEQILLVDFGSVIDNFKYVDSGIELAKQNFISGCSPNCSSFSKIK